MTSLPEQLILERNTEELDMDTIDDRLCIDGLDSRTNSGANELWVGEVIIRSPQYLKAHLLYTNCEGLNFVGLVCPYNILTRIQQRLEGEDTLTEVVKYKKELSSLKMFEDEAITF